MRIVENRLTKFKGSRIKSDVDDDSKIDATYIYYAYLYINSLYTLSLNLNIGNFRLLFLIRLIRPLHHSYIYEGHHEKQRDGNNDTLSV